MHWMSLLFFHYQKSVIVKVFAESNCTFSPNFFHGQITQISINVALEKFLELTICSTSTWECPYLSTSKYRKIRLCDYRVYFIGCPYLISYLTLPNIWNTFDDGVCFGNCPHHFRYCWTYWQHRFNFYPQYTWDEVFSQLYAAR